VRPPVALNAIHARSADQAPGIAIEGRDVAMSNREEAWRGTRGRKKLFCAFHSTVENSPRNVAMGNFER
jgi:hypothetical protein